MALDKNIAPYYDDFSDDKNYHQIMFRPGFAVQARELTQLQTIIRNQIGKFGNHMFKQGSIVIPGNSTSNLAVPYVTLELNYGNSPIPSLDLWLNRTVKGAISGVTAIVKLYEYATTNEPPVLYLAYTSGGVVNGVANGKIEFDIGEDIYWVDDPTKIAIVSGSGVGATAHINKGVYYVNETFVTVNEQSIVISKFDSTPSCHVLLQIVEEFITSDDDETLLDPAQGSYNYSAPGADRIKISLKLVSLPLDSTINDNYVEIMRFSEGVLLEHARTPKYNEIEKYMAGRTYDESGDYIVDGFETTIREHYRESANGGLTTTGSRDNYAVTVSPGKAYIKGYAVERMTGDNVIAPKARTADHIKIDSANLRPEFGKYILITALTYGPNIAQREIIDLYDDNDYLNASATKVGSARVLAIDYHIGDPSTNNAIYKLYLTEISFTSTGYSMDNVGGIRFGASASAAVVQLLNAPLTASTHNIGDIVNYNSGVRTATVAYWNQPLSELYVYKHDHTKESPRVGDQIVNATTSSVSVVSLKQSFFGTAQNAAIFELPKDYIKSMRNASNVYDLQYTSQTMLTIVTNASGDGSVTIGSGKFKTPEVGSFSAFYEAGIVSNTLFSLNIAGNTLTLTGGPVSKTVNVYATVTKTGVAPKTKTLTQATASIVFSINQTVAVLPNADVYSILSITLNSVDVTDRFTLDNGQTDYAYYKSSIVLKSGYAEPVGTLSVTYKYFSHSSGDFFVRDSYSLNANYESLVLMYSSKTSGKDYNLNNCIDCRPTVNSSNTFGSGALVGDMLVNGEQFSSSIQFYIPRIDALTYYKTGDIKIVMGKPSETPIPPLVGDEAIAVEHYYIPAYTDSVEDIKKTRLAVQRYTMRDISEIDDRITKLEEFSVLSATENSLVNYDVVDAQTGLSRFKTGYLSETFETPLVIADVYGDQFVAAFSEKSLIAAAEEMDCPVELYAAGSSEYQITNNFISLPYTEVTLASQPLSSRITNLNPFLVIRWNGILKCTPDRDYWVDIIDLPTIFINVSEVVTITRFVNRAGGPAVSETRVVTRSDAVAPPKPSIAVRKKSRKIICTKLYELGMMDHETYIADQKFGELLAESDPVVMKGYAAWASIVVDWMNGDGINMGISNDTLRKWATAWAHDIATPWAKEMAHQIDPTKQSSKTGSTIMKIGKVLSRFVGKYDLAQKPTFFTGVALISVFAVLKLITMIRGR